MEAWPGGGQLVEEGTGDPAVGAEREKERERGEGDEGQEGREGGE